MCKTTANFVNVNKIAAEVSKQKLLALHCVLDCVSLVHFVCHIINLDEIGPEKKVSLINNDLDPFQRNRKKNQIMIKLNEFATLLFSS